MKELLDGLKKLCDGHCEDSDEQMYAILRGEEELDRGHAQDCYASGVEDGNNEFKGFVLELINRLGM